MSRLYLGAPIAYLFSLTFRYHCHNRLILLAYQLALPDAQPGWTKTSLTLGLGRQQKCVGRQSGSGAGRPYWSEGREQGSYHAQLRSRFSSHQPVGIAGSRVVTRRRLGCYLVRASDAAVVSKYRETSARAYTPSSPHPVSNGLSALANYQGSSPFLCSVSFLLLRTYDAKRARSHEMGKAKNGTASNRDKLRRTLCRI
jgi:hypothetical protein